MKHRYPTFQMQLFTRKSIMHRLVIMRYKNKRNITCTSNGKSWKEEHLITIKDFYFNHSSTTKNLEKDYHEYLHATNNILIIIHKYNALV